MAPTSSFFARGLLVLAAAASLPSAVLAQNPRAWIDTDRGPIFIELDQENAPVTTQHLLELMAEGYYQDLVFHVVRKGDFIQGGGYGLDGKHKVSNNTVPSERDNGLQNLPGTVGLDLPRVNGVPQYASGTTQFYINTRHRTERDGVDTVFGKVVYGMPVVTAMENIANVPSTFAPRSPPVMHRMVEIQGEGFPVMPLHTAAWYDPANPYRGISVDVTTSSGEPVLVVYWYDYVDGAQVWMTGAAAFEYGATEVVVPLSITEGDSLQDAGSMTVRFSGCDDGSFSYDTTFGTGTLLLERLTVQDDVTCPAS